MSSPNPQSARHAAPVRGVGIGAWTTILVITLFTVAMIVWAGINASQFPTATIQQRQAIEAVQTPGDNAGAPPPAPAEVPAGEVVNVVRMPSFALWAPGRG